MKAHDELMADWRRNLAWMDEQVRESGKRIVPLTPEQQLEHEQMVRVLLDERQRLRAAEARQSPTATEALMCDSGVEAQGVRADTRTPVDRPPVVAGSQASMRARSIVCAFRKIPVGGCRARRYKLSIGSEGTTPQADGERP